MEGNIITPLNRLLDSLPPDEQHQIQNNSKTVELSAGDILCEHAHIPACVYFPLSGLVSLAVSVDDEAPFEVAMVGSEGIIGATRILGISGSPTRSIVRVKGQAVRMTTSAFDELASPGSALHAAVARFLFLLLTQSNRTAACSRFHELNSRLARWLLMSHDRTANDELALSQQFLSEILGVQRSAVSIAASAMQTRKLITYSRGRIVITDRTGLEAMACSCYAATVGDLDHFS